MWGEPEGGWWYRRSSQAEQATKLRRCWAGDNEPTARLVEAATTAWPPRQGTSSDRINTV